VKFSELFCWFLVPVH